ncbi:MAG: EAL domain-containing protein [Synechococcaceae cyanobacterium ELA263]
MSGLGLGPDPGPEPGEDDQSRRLRRRVKRLEYELTQAVQVLPHLRQMVEFSGDLLLLLNGEGLLLESNGRLASLLELPAAELHRLPLERWLVLPSQVAVLRRRLEALGAGQAMRMEVAVCRAAGDPLPMELEALRLPRPAVPGARDACWTLSLRDLSERRRLESTEAMLQVQRGLILELRDSETRYRELVDQLADGLALLDLSQRIQFANPAMAALLGCSTAAAMGRCLSAFIAPGDLATWQQQVGALLAGRPRRCQLGFVAASGRCRLLELEFTPRWDRAGRPAGTTLLARDVSELTAARLELERLAFTDQLTGLGNKASSRRFLDDQLSRRADRPLVVMWLDLDGFRRLNHTHGRLIGDQLLCAVADHLRGWSAPGDWLARMGGDEFLVIRPGLDRDGAGAMAADLQATLAYGVQLPKGEGMGMGFCAGLSLHPDHGGDGSSLLSQAATALGQASDAGQGLVMVYESGFTETLRAELSLEGRLRRALKSGGLRVVYQPQVDGHGVLIGNEALARWRDGERGDLSPTIFIPLAERTGLIQALGCWVLEQACAQQRRWQLAGLDPPPVAVNVSPCQLLAPLTPMSELVAAALERHGLEPQSLELEITESGILPITGVRGELERLASLGVTLAIDDFGTGYSSLESLHRLPIHKLKIDQSFTANLTTSASARTIVRAALTMARELGLQTLVEGVETAEQAALLAGLGCDRYQGCHLARPLEVEAFTALLERRQQTRPA